MTGTINYTLVDPSFEKVSIDHIETWKSSDNAVDLVLNVVKVALTKDSVLRGVLPEYWYVFFVTDARDMYNADEPTAVNRSITYMPKSNETEESVIVEAKKYLQLTLLLLSYENESVKKTLEHQQLEPDVQPENRMFRTVLNDDVMTRIDLIEQGASFYDVAAYLRGSVYVRANGEYAEGKKDQEDFMLFKRVPLDRRIPYGGGVEYYDKDNRVVLEISYPTSMNESEAGNTILRGFDVAAKAGVHVYLLGSNVRLK